jgi:DNA-binding GntR family transcriptional regulator
MALSENTEAEIISPLEARIDIEAAGRLALDEDRVMSLTLRRLYGSVPFAVTTILVPVSVGPALESDGRFTDLWHRSRVTAIGRIEELIPGSIADAEQSISAVAASESVAEALTCAPGTANLRIDRLYSDVDGRPVELVKSYFDPAHYTYRVRLRYHPG